MPKKIVDLSTSAPIPAPWDITPEEEAAILAQYMAGRPSEALEEDYRDFEKQVADGVLAEQLLKELKEDTSIE